jgi:hypothetical protein
MVKLISTETMSLSIVLIIWLTTHNHVASADVQTTMRTWNVTESLKLGTQVVESKSVIRELKKFHYFKLKISHKDKNARACSRAANM